MSSVKWKPENYVVKLVPTLSKVNVPHIPTTSGYRINTVAGYRYQYVSFENISRSSYSLALQDRPGYGTRLGIDTLDKRCNQCGSSIIVDDNGDGQSKEYTPRIQKIIEVKTWPIDTKANCSCRRIQGPVRQTAPTKNGHISYGNYYQSRCITFDSLKYGTRIPSLKYGLQEDETTNVYPKQCYSECNTMVYKPNNSPFATQGAVSCASQIKRLGDNSRTMNAASQSSAFGLYNGNFGRYSIDKPETYFIHNAAPMCVENVWLAGSRRLYTTRPKEEKPFLVSLRDSSGNVLNSTSYIKSFTIGNQTVYDAFTPEDFMFITDKKQLNRDTGNLEEGPSASSSWGGDFIGNTNMNGFVFECARDPSIRILVYLAFTNLTGDISDCSSNDCSFKLQIEYRGYRGTSVKKLEVGDILSTTISPVYTDWGGSIDGQIDQPGTNTPFQLEIEVTSVP